MSSYKSQVSPGQLLSEGNWAGFETLSPLHQKHPLESFGSLSENLKKYVKKLFAGFFYRADIWLDQHLHPISKNLLMEVYSLEQLPLGCIASNNHFAQVLNIATRTVGRYIKELISDGYLTLVKFNGNRRKLEVNLERLEPRQVVHTDRQIVDEAGQIGQPTSTDCPHNSITYYNHLNTNSISIAEEKKTKEKKVESSPPKTKAQTRIPFTPAADNHPKNIECKAVTVTTAKSAVTVQTKPQNVKSPKASQKNKKEGGKTDKSAITAISLPFASKAFKDKWDDWLAYRKEIKRPYKSKRAIRQIFTQLYQFEEAFVLELINTSIANEWRGLVFPKTKEVYQQWLANQAQAKQAAVPSQGTGTRAKPQNDLMAATQESNQIYQRLQRLENQKDTFETFPAHLLEPIAEQLRAMWRRGRVVEMHPSEISRISTLGQTIAKLIKAKKQKIAKEQQKIKTKITNTSPKLNTATSWTT